MRTNPPLFSREAMVAAILAYNAMGMSILNALAVLTAFMSGLGFVSGFDDPNITTYLSGAVFGFAVFLIAKGFWHGAWMAPDHIERDYMLAFVIVATLGFGSFGVVSYFGNQKFVAGDISHDLAIEDRINRLANGTQSIITYVGQIGPIEADLGERATQAARFAEAEASGSGPTGVGGKGPVYFGFTASADTYADARSLLVGRVEAFKALSSNMNALVAKLRAAKANTSLSKSERKRVLKTVEGEALGLMREALALDPAGSIAAAAELVGKGIPTPNLSSSKSAAKIAEINNGMKAYAEVLRAKLKQIEANKPELPDLSSQSQEEHLLANALRFPALSLAALLFDACGWVIIGFRFLAYRSLRLRDEREEAMAYDIYVTPRDFERVTTMSDIAREAKTKLLDSPKPRGRPRGSKKKSDGESNND